MNPQHGRRSYRPVDLAREHGLSTQAVRNYERAGILPAARRTASGYRVYTTSHVLALRAHVALVPAYGHGVAAEIMRAANRGDLDAALRAVDHGHAQLLRDRETLDAVAATVDALTAAPTADRPDPPARPLPVGALAHRLGVTPATLRKWERAGILVPPRDPISRQRLYRPDDVRDADLAHLLRRGGYLLDHIATVLHQVRAAAGSAPLAASLNAWRQRLTARGRAMLVADGRLAEHLDAT
ncbi:MerR family transcriptional regulator [Micromonospora endolithica]|uniref:MerR family DNA-binding transcriptional regulator n=1 Tax=Micromonospora endolithica TaxID=230091 RepID=A0A3A9YU85_9ACTN|nr:MerR family transcriptional regulator [Micromonospora endolithica]RKN39632.1 MerR family DNA-binding transcriptional regulator [Micromonospora endolithica]TWJ22228.1 DNA-binding transcriptional MerR regulator [Micromonospora endolithica]